MMATRPIALYEKQLEYYLRLCDDHPDQFRLVLNQTDLREVLAPWDQAPALPAGNYLGGRRKSAAAGHPPGWASSSSWKAPKASAPHPIWNTGGKEAYTSPGPSGQAPGSAAARSFRASSLAKGLELLEIMGELGYTLDLSHMNEVSALQALDRYSGPVAATHANARALLKDAEGERQLTDRTIRRLIERDGVIGVVPFNRFLLTGWKTSDDRQAVTLRSLAAHIDHICQLAGDALHVGLGTDFDGGFGWPSVPYEINTIADLQKITSVLADYGYNEESIAGIQQDATEPSKKTSKKKNISPTKKVNCYCKKW